MHNRSFVPLLAALVAAAAAAPLLAQGTVSAGQTVSGRLTAADPTLEDGSHFHLWVYQGGAGESLMVTLRSADFDAYLTWGRLDGTTFHPLASDDDGAGGTDSRLFVRVEGGRHAIRTNSLLAGETGAYTLSVEPAGTGGQTARPGGAAAVQTRTIALGETVRGRLAATDPVLGDGTHFHQYLYRGRPGEVVLVTLRSADFDAMLVGGRLAGAEFHNEQVDDDGAGGTDARLRAVVGPDGTYAFRANTFAAGETGAYALTVHPVNPLSPDGGAGPRTIRAGQTVSGRLDLTDPRLPDNSHYHAYVYEGAPGDEIVITLASRAFDAYLRWGSMDGGVFQALAEDDDGADGTDARLHAVVDGAGRYVIQANTLGGGETGEYILTVERSTTQAAARTAALGETARGRLASTSPVLGDDSHYELWLYRGTPGEQVVVTMRSTDFDSYLLGGRPLGGGRVEVADRDDDSAGGLDARILATVGPGGTYAIQANSVRPRQTGAYSLTVQPASAVLGTRRAVPPGVPALEPGGRVTGTLGRTGRVLPDSSYFEEYVYTGAPGQRVRFTLTSGDFDAFLLWGRLDERGGFHAEATDDDGAGGTDARLEVAVGAAGGYALRVNSFGAGETGRYTLAAEVLSATAPLATDRATGAGQGKWIPAYAEPRASALRGVAQRLKQQQFLEGFAEGLNQRFPLPGNLSVRAEECGEENAHYRPSERAIVLCYEFAERIARRHVPDGRWTPEQRDAVTGALTFIMMHEVGHALVDVLDLPITGREEDAVDQLAAVILIEAGDKGAWSALNGVLALQSGGAVDEARLAGVHSLDAQRLYNVACWIYGSDPLRYEVLVTNGLLPTDRAMRCPGEYERLSKAWHRLLQPRT
jgi:hypothetical protein